MSLNERLKREEEEANAAILEQQNEPAPKKNTGEEVKAQTNDGNDIIPAPADSEVNFEGRYKALRGKYEAEVPILHKQIKELQAQKGNEGRVQELEAKVQTLTQENNLLKSHSSNKDNSETTKQDVDAYFKEEFGEEAARAIQNMIESRVAKAPQNSNEVNELREKVDRMEHNNDQTQAQRNTDSLIAMLKAQNIDFNDVNNDPMFIDWLKNEEGSTNQPRNHFMNSHFANGDIQRTASYFVNYKAHERSLLNKSGPLDEHVTVEGNNNVSDTGTGEDIWTEQDVNNLYDDYQHGRITEAEFNKFEQQLFRAQASGNYQG